MIVLLDHCVPGRFQHLLHSWGHTAHLLSAHIAPDSPDSAVIALATQLDAVLLTLDLDFSNILDYPPARYSGIVVLRYEIQDEQDLDNTLQAMLSDLSREDLRNALVIVSPGRYRVRR